MQKAACVASWQGHTGEVYSIQFSSDETSCYTMGSDGKVQHCNMPLSYLGRMREEHGRGAGTHGNYIVTCLCHVQGGRGRSRGGGRGQALMGILL